MRNVATICVTVMALTASTAQGQTELPTYRSTVLLNGEEIIEGYGDNDVEASADAMRVCLNLGDDCAPGATAPWEWMHLLVTCPEKDIAGMMAFQPKDPSRVSAMMTDNPELAQLANKYIQFECTVDRDYSGQPVLAWLISRPE